MASPVSHKKLQIKLRQLLILVIILSCHFASAQKKLHADDSSIVVERTFNKTALDQFKKDKEFQYEHIKEPPQSLWQRFWTWFWFKVNQLLSTKQGRTTLWTVFVLLAIAIIGFFVFKVMGMNRQGLFGRSSGTGLEYLVSSDNIHSISFDEAIEQAVASGNYRLAIRLLYLQTLKKLSDAGFIQWQINKTNTDYLKEVSTQQWQPLFTSLTYNFDYTWYGEVPVDKERFNSVKEEFNSFNKQL